MKEVSESRRRGLRTPDPDYSPGDPGTPDPSGCPPLALPTRFWARHRPIPGAGGWLQVWEPNLERVEPDDTISRMKILAYRFDVPSY